MRADRWVPFLLFAACAPPEPVTAPVLSRAGRFGTFRDLVLFDRPASAGGPFFLDRFEVTRADWTGFVEEVGEGPAPPAGDGALPMAGVDLHEARAFAVWRFCRLPRLDEWRHAATSDGRHKFLWGDTWRATRANTHELGLGEPTLVGTFESGRRGDGPYDLIGNVAEWTESVFPGWFRDDRTAFPDLGAARRVVQRLPGLGVWLVQDGLVPACWAVQAIAPRVPRMVVGGDYLSVLMPPGGEPAMQRELYPGDRSAAVGLRLCTDPSGLCLALGSHPEAASPAETELLLRMLLRARHREVLGPAWRAVKADLASRGLAPGPLGRLLDQELGL